MKNILSPLFIFLFIASNLYASEPSPEGLDSRRSVSSKGSNRSKDDTGMVWSTLSGTGGKFSVIMGECGVASLIAEKFVAHLMDVIERKQDAGDWAVYQYIDFIENEENASIIRDYIWVAKDVYEKSIIEDRYAREATVLQRVDEEAEADMSTVVTGTPGSRRGGDGDTGFLVGFSSPFGNRGDASSFGFKTPNRAAGGSSYSGGTLRDLSGGSLSTGEPSVAPSPSRRLTSPTRPRQSFDDTLGQIRQIGEDVNQVRALLSRWAVPMEGLETDPAAVTSHRPLRAPGGSDGDSGGGGDIDGDTSRHSNRLNGSFLSHTVPGAGRRGAVDARSPEGAQRKSTKPKTTDPDMRSPLLGNDDVPNPDAKGCCTIL